MGRTQKITLSAFFIALIIISGTVLNIRLPGNLPNLSTQFFFSALTGVILGPRLGSVCVAVYLAMGLCGLPVFTQGGGIYYVLKPSFGYLVGYIFCALIMGIAASKFGTKIKFLIPAAFISLAVLYTIGTVYMYFVLNLYLKIDTSIIGAIKAGVVPFIITDSVWCVLIGVCGNRLALLREKIF